MFDPLKDHWGELQLLERELEKAKSLTAMISCRLTEAGY
jgi:hypothetical protein